MTFCETQFSKFSEIKESHGVIKIFLKVTYQSNSSVITHRRLILKAQKYFGTLKTNCITGCWCTSHRGKVGEKWKANKWLANPDWSVGKTNPGADKSHLSIDARQICQTCLTQKVWPKKTCQNCPLHTLLHKDTSITQIQKYPKALETTLCQ